MTDHEPLDASAPDNRRHDWLTTAELSLQYGFSVGTLRYWRHRGYGPACFSLGRKVVYRRAAVEAWIAEQEQRTQRGGTSAA